MHWWVQGGGVGLGVAAGLVMYMGALRYGGIAVLAVHMGAGRARLGLDIAAVRIVYGVMGAQAGLRGGPTGGAVFVIFCRVIARQRLRRRAL